MVVWQHLPTASNIVINLTHLSLRHNERSLFIWQSSYSVVFIVAVLIGWDESVLCAVSRIFIDVIVNHILFSFVINL